jgi:hypothetical protein
VKGRDTKKLKLLGGSQGWFGRVTGPGPGPSGRGEVVLGNLDIPTPLLRLDWMGDVEPNRELGTTGTAGTMAASNGMPVLR